MSNTTHPALLKAMEIYDRPGDLAPHEKKFLQSVHRASQARMRSKTQAMIDYGYGSKTYEALAERCDHKELKELAAALAAYEQALEDE